MQGNGTRPALFALWLGGLWLAHVAAARSTGIWKIPRKVKLMIRSFPATRMATWTSGRLALIGALAVPLMACIEDGSDPPSEEAELVLEEGVAWDDTGPVAGPDDRVPFAAGTQSRTVTATKSGSPTITCTVSAGVPYKDIVLRNIMGHGWIRCSGGNLTNLGVKVNMYRAGYYFGSTAWASLINPGRNNEIYFSSACSSSTKTYWRAKVDYAIQFPSGYSLNLATGTVTGDVTTVLCR